MAERRGNRVFLWIMMALLAVGLVGFGSAGLTARTTTLGSVAGRPIAPQAYANRLRDQLAALEAQIGQPLPFAEAQGLGLDRQVLAQLVTEGALDAEAERLGLSVGDDRVAEAVLDSPSFAGLDGAFDRTIYTEQLARRGEDPESFEAGLRARTTRTMLQAAVGGGVPAPAAYAGALAAYLGERRTITWASVPTAMVAVLPAPTDADLRALHESDAAAYTAPEVRSISYAWLTPEMIQADVAVDDAAVRALYDERLDEFVQEERRLAERLVFATEAEAEAARAAIDAGGTFEEAVAARGLALADVDLGDVARADLGGAADAVFAAPSGAVVGPVPTDLGPALFRINAVLAADEVTYEEAEPDLRAELANQRARRVIADVAPEVEDLIAGGATVADLAERTDLEPGRIDWSEGVTDGIAAYETFRTAAAAATVGEVPQVVELLDGGLVALTLDAVTPPALRPFEEVEAEVRADWEARALADATAALAEDAASAIAGGASFESQGLDPLSEPPLTRRDVVDGTPPGFMALAFATAEGEPATLPAEGGALVLRVDAVAPPAPDDPALLAEREAIASQAAEAVAQDLLDAYATALQLAAEVRIDDAAVAAVNAQFQ